MRASECAHGVRMYIRVRAYTRPQEGRWTNKDSRQRGNSSTALAWSDWMCDKKNRMFDGMFDQLVKGLLDGMSMEYPIECSIECSIEYLFGERFDGMLDGMLDGMSVRCNDHLMVFDRMLDGMFDGIFDRMFDEIFDRTFYGIFHRTRGSSAAAALRHRRKSTLMQCSAHWGR